MWVRWFEMLKRELYMCICVQGLFLRGGRRIYELAVEDVKTMNRVEVDLIHPLWRPGGVDRLWRAMYTPKIIMASKQQECRKV